MSALTPRSCASAAPIMPSHATPHRMMRRKALFNFFQRDRAGGHRQRRRLDVTLDRRQVLEHEIPFPTFRRIRRLQPMLRRHRTPESERGDSVELFDAGEGLADV